MIVLQGHSNLYEKKTLLHAYAIFCGNWVKTMAADGSAPWVTTAMPLTL